MALNPRSILRNAKCRWALVFGFILLVPWLLAISKGSNLYDQWRHFYFVVPSIVAASAYGWFACGRKISRIAPQYRTAFSAIVLLLISQTAFFNVRSHPYQHAFFNSLVENPTTPLHERYQVDYWGVSYLPALRFIAEHSEGPAKVAYAEDPAEFNWDMLEPELRSRIILVEDIEQADYYVTSFRHHPKEVPAGERVFRATVVNNDVIAVYRVSSDKRP